ncbi:MAG TPA: hypothetical protein VFS65_01845 [Candidatus Saccharimonadales bacterium]|nr:hypothetical protein [Candidatus Saccharimonadales bacterium]
MDQSIVFFFAAIFVVGAIMFALIGLTKKGSRVLNVERYQKKWMEIEQQLKRTEPSSCHLVILNADKLVDQALQDRGVAGKTMGERMKNAKTFFSDNNGLWTAHKLRNQIAHESDVKISYDQTRYALASFKKALKDVGAI